MSNKNSYGFEDIVEAQQGIFDGTGASISGASAMAAYSRAQTQVMQAGMLVGMTCDGCGRNIQMVVEYPELIAIRHGVQPHVAYNLLAQKTGTRVLQEPTVWGYDQAHQGWFPDKKCACGSATRPIISVGEANSAIQQAVNKGWVQAQQAQALAQWCAGLQQQVG